VTFHRTLPWSSLDDGGPGRSSNSHHSINRFSVDWELTMAMCFSPEKLVGSGVSQPYRNNVTASWLL
jgi:hypothetical protein